MSRDAGGKGPEISVVVPVLDEAPCLEELCSRVVGHLEDEGRSFELIFVDDGSTDETPAILERLSLADGRVGNVRHPRNQGKTLALYQGFDVARGEVCVTIDGDLQDEPENIGRLLEELERGGWDLVSGNRVDRRDNVARRFLSWCYNTLIRVLFGHRFQDVNCGLKAYSRRLYERIELHGGLHRLTPVVAANYGFRVTELPVSHSPRAHGRSRYSLIRYQGLLDVVLLAVLQATQVRPFHAFGGLGLLALVVAVLVGVGCLCLPSTGPVGTLRLGGLLLAQAALVVGALLMVAGLLAELLMGPVRNVEWRRGLVGARRLPRDVEGSGLAAGAGGDGTEEVGPRAGSPGDSSD